MEYGKEAVVKFLGQLLVRRRITLKQYDTLCAAEFIESPKVCVWVKAAKHNESGVDEVVVKCMTLLNEISAALVKES